MIEVRPLNNNFCTQPMTTPRGLSACRRFVFPQILWYIPRVCVVSLRCAEILFVNSRKKHYRGEGTDAVFFVVSKYLYSRATMCQLQEYSVHRRITVHQTTSKVPRFCLAAIALKPTGNNSCDTFAEIFQVPGKPRSVQSVRHRR